MGKPIVVFGSFVVDLTSRSNGLPVPGQTILGASFQIQINNFLENTTVSRLAQDSEVVANLASAYGMVGNLHSRELLLNLDVVSQITNADIVICDNEGYIILCSGDLGGGNHDGWQINQDFLDKVYQSGSYSATGTIRKSRKP